MIPRQRSIFTVGDQEVDLERKMDRVGCRRSTATSRSTASNVNMINTNNKSPAVIGLRILIHSSPSTRESSTVVAKSSLRPCRVPGAQSSRSAAAFPTLSFLKACHLCRKELSPQKDVYIYKGEQAFCSSECRCEQILLDERREFETAARKRRRAASSRLRAEVAAARVRDMRRPEGWGMIPVVAS